MSKPLTCADRAAWRAWLKSNHAKASEVWLVFYKGKARGRGVLYGEAVEEALCYGWIDSLVRRLDDERYMQKFTPRKPKSKWSASNKKRVAELIASKRMAAPGRRVIAQAQKDGSWDERPDAEKTFAMPVELKRALAKANAARRNFEALPPSHQKQYVQWVASAKRPETRERRSAKALEMLSRGEKLGMV